MFFLFSLATTTRQELLPRPIMLSTSRDCPLSFAGSPDFSQVFFSLRPSTASSLRTSPGFLLVVIFPSFNTVSVFHTSKIVSNGLFRFGTPNTFSNISGSINLHFVFHTEISYKLRVTAPQENIPVSYQRSGSCYYRS